MSAPRDDDAWIGDILDALDVGVFRIDQVTERIVRLNAACARIFGFEKPEDGVGVSALEMYEDPKERREIATRFEANEEYRRTGIALLEGRRVRVDTREPFDAQIRLKAVFDASLQNDGPRGDDHAHRCAVGSGAGVPDRRAAVPRALRLGVGPDGARAGRRHAVARERGLLRVPRARGEGAHRRQLLLLPPRRRLRRVRRRAALRARRRRDRVGADGVVADPRRPGERERRDRHSGRDRAEARRGEPPPRREARVARRARRRHRARLQQRARGGARDAHARRATDGRGPGDARAPRRGGAGRGSRARAREAARDVREGGKPGEARRLDRAGDPHGRGLLRAHGPRERGVRRGAAGRPVARRHRRRADDAGVPQPAPQRRAGDAARRARARGGGEPRDWAERARALAAGPLRASARD